MKKKIIAIFLAVVMVLSIGLVAASCDEAGTAGPAGKSAYEIAKDNGFTGTEAEWLESLKGTNGTNGTGTPGADGATWLEGEGAPATTLGNNGDFYFDSVTNKVYKKTSGAWTEVADLTGGQGPAGSTGPSGATWLTDIGNPNDGEVDGKEGDFYFDSLTGDVWQMDDEGEWQFVVNLFGQDGEDGTSIAWLTGAANPTIDTVANVGDFYLNTTTGQLYRAIGYQTTWKSRSDLAAGISSKEDIPSSWIKGFGWAYSTSKTKKPEDADWADDSWLAGWINGGTTSYTEYTGPAEEGDFYVYYTPSGPGNEWKNYYVYEMKSITFSQYESTYGALEVGDIYVSYNYPTPPTPVTYSVNEKILTLNWGSPLITIKGTNGTNGATWHTGTGAPTSSNPSTKGAGDMYLDLSTGDLYKYGWSWSKVGNIKGMEGHSIQTYVVKSQAEFDALELNDGDFVVNKSNGYLALGVANDLVRVITANSAVTYADGEFFATSYGAIVEVDLDDVTDGNNILPGVKFADVTLKADEIEKYAEFCYWVEPTKVSGFNQYEANLNIEYDLDSLKNGDKYTRVFKTEQLTGTKGATQLYAVETLHEQPALGKDGNYYWDILNNKVDAISNGDTVAALKNLLNNEDYTGYWGSMLGNTYNDSNLPGFGSGDNSAASVSTMFAAANGGLYAITCDIYKLDLAKNTYLLAGRTVNYVYVRENVQTVDYVGILNMGNDKFADCEEAYYVARPTGIKENVTIAYDVAGLNVGDRYTRVFKVEGTGDVQLLANDGDYGNGKDLYFDIANNAEDFDKGDYDGVHSTAIETLLTSEYTGFWGAREGNIWRANSDTSLSATFAADAEGLYAITCDIYKINKDGTTLRVGRTVTYVNVVKSEIEVLAEVDFDTIGEEIGECEYAWTVATPADNAFFEANVTVDYDLTGLVNTNKYIRVFNVEGAGAAQLLAKSSTGNDYYDIANNAVDFEGDTDFVGGLTKAAALLTGPNAYDGFWGARDGNPYTAGTTTTSGNFMLTADTEGMYTITCDIYKLDPTDVNAAVLVGRTVTYVWVTVAASVAP